MSNSFILLYACYEEAILHLALFPCLQHTLPYDLPRHVPPISAKKIPILLKKCLKITQFYFSKLQSFSSKVEPPEFKEIQDLFQLCDYQQQRLTNPPQCFIQDRSEKLNKLLSENLLQDLNYLTYIHQNYILQASKAYKTHLNPYDILLLDDNFRESQTKFICRNISSLRKNIYQVELTQEIIIFRYERQMKIYQEQNQQIQRSVQTYYNSYMNRWNRIKVQVSCSHQQLKPSELLSPCREVKSSNAERNFFFSERKYSQFSQGSKLQLRSPQTKQLMEKRKQNLTPHNIKLTFTIREKERQGRLPSFKDLSKNQLNNVLVSYLQKLNNNNNKDSSQIGREYKTYTPVKKLQMSEHKKEKTLKNDSSEYGDLHMMRSQGNITNVRLKKQFLIALNQPYLKQTSTEQKQQKPYKFY